MEREILFRGKAINRDIGYHRTMYKNGDWVYGLVTRLYDERFENLPAEMTNIDGVSGIEVDYKTIGRYTGLTDKNGRRIFEGDILDLTPYMITDVGVVKFGEYKDLDMGDDYPCGHVGFYVDVEKQRISVRKDILFFAPECKVIGNVHDNPELLKGENND